MNHGHLTASRIRIDEDEGHIVLLIDSDEEDTITVDIHGIAVEFHDDVRREIGPWAHEAEDARQAVAAGVPLKVYTKVVSVEDAIEDGYALDDPKHPQYHSTHADLWDARDPGRKRSY